ncbi:hypothetical protein EVG20_g5001 [Dentipellis fragilis]|uniref:Uncharacterized protein n=1 Tax=Dentipellis fragilis TaxID=205917 RepID=A0A4Y9YWI9_9AGAM|nr:hypothetical protein EVG20_g5001 [Dentipellis fragilis]
MRLLSSRYKAHPSTTLRRSLPNPILAMVYYPPSFPLDASEVLYVPGIALDPVTFHVLLAFALIAFAIALLGVLRQKWSPSELLRALQAMLIGLCDDECLHPLGFLDVGTTQVRSSSHTNRTPFEGELGNATSQSVQQCATVRHSRSKMLRILKSRLAPGISPLRRFYPILALSPASTNPDHEGYDHELFIGLAAYLAPTQGPRSDPVHAWLQYTVAVDAERAEHGGVRQPLLRFVRDAEQGRDPPVD